MVVTIPRANIASILRSFDRPQIFAPAPTNHSSRTAARPNVVRHPQSYRLRRSGRVILGGQSAIFRDENILVESHSVRNAVAGGMRSQEEAACADSARGAASPAGPERNATGQRTGNRALRDK